MADKFLFFTEAWKSFSHVNLKTASKAWLLPSESGRHNWNYCCCKFVEFGSSNTCRKITVWDFIIIYFMRIVVDGYAAIVRSYPNYHDNKFRQLLSYYHCLESLRPVSPATEV